MSLNMKHKSIFEESTSDEIDAANVVSDKDETRKKVRKKMLHNPKNKLNG